MAKKSDKKSESKSVGFAYDDSKDVVVRDFGTIEGAGGRSGDFSARLMSYNGGAPKLALARTGAKENGEVWFSPKLGRLTASEVNALLPVLTRAAKIMEKKSKTTKE